jgi:hypothetical protein
MPDLEKDKFNTMEAASGNMLEGEALIGLDDKAHESLIA